MGYRVDYAPADRAFRCRQGTASRVAAFSALFFLSFILMLRLVWAEGLIIMKEMLLPCDVEVAIDVFAGELKSGTSFGNSVFNFCKEILRRAAA